MGMWLRAGWAILVCPGPSLEWELRLFVPEPQEHQQDICWNEENAVGRRQEGARRMKTCWTCKTLIAAQIKKGSKIKLEAPVGMEEINTENYLTTNQIVWVKERFRLYRKLHCWYFLCFEGETSYKLVRLLWHNSGWYRVSSRCKSCLRYLNFDREFETTQSSDPGDLFGLISSQNTQLRSHDSIA